MLKQSKAKLITCILPKGKVISLVEGLQKKGIHRSQFAFARGSDLGDPMEKGGLSKEVEKDVFSVIATDEQEGEEIFAWLFEEAQINHPGGGMMYMTSLNYATPFALPQV